MSKFLTLVDLNEGQSKLVLKIFHFPRGFSALLFYNTKTPLKSQKYHVL